MNNQAKTGILGWLIGVTAFLYVVGAYTLLAIPEASRANVTLAVLLAFFLLCRLIANGRLSVPRSVFIPCAFLGFAALSMAWARGPSEAAWDVIITSSTILGALGIWVATRNGLSWRTIAWACATGAVIEVLSASSQVAAAGLSGRAAGLAANANSFAMLLSYAAFFIWCTSAKPSGSPRGKLFVRLSTWGLGVFAAGVIAHAMLFTGSRKMLLVVPCAGLLALMHVLPKLKLRTAWLWLPLGCWLAVAAVVLIDIYRADVEGLGAAQTFQRMQDALSGKRPDVRLEMMREALAMWRLQPVIGHGAGQYAVLGSFQGYSHNNYTELLVDFGVVGFVLYYSLHLLVLVSAIRGVLRGSVPHRSAFVLVLTILLLDMAMVTYSAKMSWLFLVFVVDLAGARSASPVPSTRRVSRAWSVRRPWAGLPSPNWRGSRLHPR